MVRLDPLRPTRRRSHGRSARTSTGFAVATVAAFAAIATGTAAAIATDRPHAAAFVALVGGAATLLAALLVASLVHRRLVAVSTDARSAGLEPSSDRTDADGNGDAGEDGPDRDGSLEASTAALPP